MTKKHFIALADMVRIELPAVIQAIVGDEKQALKIADEVGYCLADFCATQNSQFNRHRWLSYIAGERGPNGGKVKA